MKEQSQHPKLVREGIGSSSSTKTNLDLDHGHRLLELSVMPGSSVDGLGDVLEDEVEVDLVLLQRNAFEQRGKERSSAQSHLLRFEREDDEGDKRTFSPFE